MFGVTRRLRPAYAATDYVVRAGLRTVMIHVGRRCITVDRLLARHGSHSGAFVTAWNPWGLQRARHINMRALQRLRAALRERKLRFCEGEGRGHDATWPPEASLLVFGLRRTDAAKLGRRLRQNAVVWVRRGGGTELLALR